MMQSKLVQSSRLAFALSFVLAGCGGNKVESSITQTGPQPSAQIAMPTPGAKSAPCTSSIAFDPNTKLSYFPSELHEALVDGSRTGWTIQNMTVFVYNDREQFEVTADRADLKDSDYDSKKIKTICKNLQPSSRAEVSIEMPDTVISWTGQYPGMFRVTASADRAGEINGQAALLTTFKNGQPLIRTLADWNPKKLVRMQISKPAPGTAIVITENLVDQPEGPSLVTTRVVYQQK